MCDEILTLVTKIKIDHLEQNGLGLPLAAEITASSPLFGTHVVNWQWGVCTLELGSMWAPCFQTSCFQGRSCLLFSH